MKKREKLISTKVFRITEAAVRRYCEAVLPVCTEKEIQLCINESMQPIRGTFHSSDGFLYYGKVSCNSNDFEASCKRFLRYRDVLLFGYWKTGDAIDEFCIHARYHEFRFAGQGKCDGPFFYPAA